MKKNKKQYWIQAVQTVSDVNMLSKKLEKNILIVLLLVPSFIFSQNHDYVNAL